MSDLTAKFSTLQAQLDIAHEETQTTLDNLYALIGAMSDTITTIQQNNAINARLLLNAIGQNSPCAPCPTPPLVVTPIADLTPTINTEKCQRAQAIVDAIGAMLAVWDTFSTFDLSANFTIITDAISQVIAEIAAGDTIPLPSFPEAVQLAGLVASFTGYNLFAGTSLVAEYTPLKEALVSAIYNGSTIAASKSAFDSIISGGMSSAFLSDAVIATGYAALWSYYLDDTTEPDLSGYSGAVCGLEGCWDLSSEAVAITGYGTRQAIVWSSPFVGQNNDPAPTFYNKNQVLVGDYYGWGVTLLSGAGCRLIYWSGGIQGGLTSIGAGTPINVHTEYLYLDDFLHGGAFSIRFCSPGEF